MATSDTGRLTEFYVFSKQELEKISTPSSTLVPPLNTAVDTVLNRNNEVATLPQHHLTTFLEKLPADGLVQYAGLKHKLIVDGIPTRRAAGYYVRALTTSHHKETDDAVYHETLRVALALLQVGLSQTTVHNTEILQELNQKKYSKYSFDAWQRN